MGVLGGDIERPSRVRFGRKKARRTRTTSENENDFFPERTGRLDAFARFHVDSAGPRVLAHLFFMQSTVLTTVAATGFTVAFVHAVIPTHWLPFVLVARARNWGRGKTLLVTTLAGLGHVALTSVLGLAIAWFGFQLEEKVVVALADGHLEVAGAGVLLFLAAVDGHRNLPSPHAGKSSPCR